MTDAASILVIILAIVLSIFLILGIVLVVLLIRITRQIKDVTSTVQGAADNISHVVANVSKYTTPAILGKTLLAQLKKLKR